MPLYQLGGPAATDLAAGTSNLLTAGEETVERDKTNSSALSVGSSGSLRMVHFTARKTETTTQVRILTGATAAAATPTLIRLALFQIDATGGGTLVAATASDTAVFSAANTAYTRSWTTPFAKVAGQRYAVGVLVVTAGLMPSLCGTAVPGALGAEAAIAPMRASVLNAQADLPASFAVGSLGTSGSVFYAAILP